MKRRILSLCLVVLLVSTLLIAPFTVGAEDTKYIVMVLDESGPVGFRKGGKTIYIADSSISYVKEAAKKFVQSTLGSDSNQQIAIVSYHKESFLQHSFSNDVDSLINSIDNMYAHEAAETNLTAGLEAAHSLLNPLQGEKNVVIFTTGYGSLGASYDDGYYDSSTVGSEWDYAETGINLYKYANGSHRIADQIKSYAKIYTVGLFQTMEEMPSAGKEIAEFFRLFAKDLASSKDYFYLVEDVEKLNSAFETVAEDIQVNPSIWAKGEITEAKDLGLIPQTLEGKDLSKKITRGEFAAVALELYEALSGKTAPSSDSSFRDITDNENEDSIKKAYGLNIVAGVSQNEFSPDSKISREDLAAMLCRAIKKYKFEDWSLDTDDDYYLDSEGVKKYADDADISGYAKPSVYYLTKMGILNGVSETHFAPKNTTSEQEAQGYATATREQAIALSLRIFKISELLNVSIEPAQNTPDWKRAYADFLKDLQKKYQNKKNGYPHFELAYVNGDEIPELVIISGTSHGEGGYLYTYYNGEVTPVNWSDANTNQYGTFGTFMYKEKEGLIYVGNMQRGYVTDTIWCMNEAAVAEQKYFLTNDENAVENASEASYTVNGGQVSKAEYDAKYNEYGFNRIKDEYKKIDSSAPEVNDETIKAALGL